MPILDKYVSHTELAFFIQYFLPLAAKCDAVAAKQKLTGNIIQQKVYEALAHQIWELLPAFCTKPTDLLQVSLSIHYIQSEIRWDNRNCMTKLFDKIVMYCCSL